MFYQINNENKCNKENTLQSGATLKRAEGKRHVHHNGIKKLSALEKQIAQLQEQADAIKGELKADLEEKGLEELKTKNFLIRWKEIISNRLDGKALKTALPEIYSQYCRQTSSMRFTVA